MSLDVGWFKTNHPTLQGKNRLSLYRDAAKEAEEIFDRWADEIDDLDEDFMEDEDYEPDEYYSD